jgi:hypothetical protein
LLFIERTEALNQIDQHRITSGDIARLAEVPIQRVSDFRADRRVEARQAAKITDAVAKIARVLDELHPVKVDVRDPQNVLRALAELNKVKTEQLAAETANYVELAEIGLARTLSTN